MFDNKKTIGILKKVVIVLIILIIAYFLFLGDFIDLLFKKSTIKENSQYRNCVDEAIQKYSAEESNLYAQFNTNQITYGDFNKQYDIIDKQHREVLLNCYEKYSIIYQMSLEQQKEMENKTKSELNQ